MAKLTESIFKEIVQTEEYRLAKQKLTQAEYDKVYKQIINPMYKTDRQKADDWEMLFLQATYQSAYCGFVQGVKFALQLSKECDLL